MRVAIIGGREKNQVQLERIAAEYGHELELQCGHVHGDGVGEIRRVLARAELVVILTDVNSHAAMLVAKAHAKQLAIPTLLLRRLGSARLRALFDALEHKHSPTWSLARTEAVVEAGSYMR